MNQMDEQLCEIMDKTQILRQEPMKKHTTFRIGGAADYYLKPANQKQLCQLLSICQTHKMPYFLIGNGSNLLVSDSGYRGAVIEIQGDWQMAVVEAEQIIAGAGMKLSKVAKMAAREGLAGFEFAAGIPGTLGGALVMNAGAYGSEMKDVLVWAKVMTPQGEVRQLAAAELELGYRTSCIVGAGYIVLEVCLALKRQDSSQVTARIEELTFQRKSKQPLEYPSAGSTFKRPAGHFAAKLIDDAGLRGFQVGGAQVSEKHCGFVINKDQATAADVMNLCHHVRTQVNQKFAVQLELEVRLLGEV